MNERELQQHLYDIFEAITIANLTDDEISVPRGLIEPGKGLDWVTTFKEADLLTRDAGIIARMQDGSKFLISIVQSR